MAKITTKNRYEDAVWRLRNLEKRINPPERQISMWEERKDKFRTNQDNQVILGGMGRIKYRFFEHDPRPLAIFLSTVRSDIQAVPAINLHYLTNSHIQIIIRGLKFANGNRLKRGKPMIITYDFLKQMHIPYKAYRLYKFHGIKPMEYIPFKDWAPIGKTERNRWQGVFY